MKKNFKVFHMTSGTGILTVGLQKYEMRAGSIAFLHPDEIMSWQTTSQETKGHFCLIHPKYFEHDAEHVRHLFTSFPFFKADKAVVQLTNSQSDTINNSFKNILSEERQSNDDKKQAILLLLEATFQLEEKGVSVKHKNASEFADQLHVHPSYLNSLVKKQTGKTLRDHIQERILYEAKSLLLQTDRGINNISYGLGFSGPAAFTSFFRKKENMSPSIYRKNALHH